MFNMDYCKFENTYDALRQCYDGLSESGLEEVEEGYREKLVKLCMKIAAEYGDEYKDERS